MVDLHTMMTGLLDFLRSIEFHAEFGPQVGTTPMTWPAEVDEAPDIGGRPGNGVISM